MPSSAATPHTPLHPAPPDGKDVKMLRHIAFIMDGNRRWAKAHRLPSTAQGHFRGYQSLKTLVRYCSDVLNLPAMTVYAFSTENWNRSAPEVAFLLKLFQQTLEGELEEMHQKNLQLRFLGDLSRFPKSFQAMCARAQALMAANTGMIYQVALNYGGRAEILEACKHLIRAVQVGDLSVDTITQDDLARYLYTPSTPEPDLIIRTGGEYRLSNFLLWQSAYAELYVSDRLWPDFTPDALDQAIAEFHRRQRRFGQ